jgi:HEAT repeat protein
MDTDVRAGAASLLFGTDDSQAVAQIIRLLKDESAIVRVEAAHTLGSITDARVALALLEALKDTNKEVRKEAAWQLWRCAAPEHLDALLDALRHESADVRAGLAYAVGQIDTDRAFEALVRLLRDKSYEVRKRAVRALGLRGDRQAIPALIRTLGDKDSGVRHLARWWLGSLADQSDVDAVQAMMRCSEDKELGPRSAPAVAVRRFTPRKAVASILRFLKAEAMAAQETDACTLGRLKDEGSAAALRKRSRDSKRLVYLKAARAPRPIGKADAFAAWEQELEQASCDSSREAVDNHNVITGAEDVPLLMQLMQHEEPYIRMGAAYDLGKFGNVEAVAALCSARPGDDLFWSDELRLSVITALHAIGERLGLRIFSAHRITAMP